MPIFDTHCHYNLEPLWPEWQAHWVKAQAVGVARATVVGTSVETSEQALKIAAQDAHLFASVAIHPIEYNEPGMKSPAELVGELERLIRPVIADPDPQSIHDGRKLLAVGETGLDYFHDASTKNIQQESLHLHLRLAQQHNLPVILHVRDRGEDAYWDTLRILQAEKFTGKFVLHCVSGPTAYVQKALEMGAYVGAAGNVTYKTADHIRELVHLVPKDRLLSETDAPFLPPQAHRGQTCEPAMIAETVTFLQTELQIDAAQLWQNAHTFFGLKMPASGAAE